MTVRNRTHILFEYGMANAHPHRCGQGIPAEDHPRWLKLEAVNRELGQLREEWWEEQNRIRLP
jgi:hypothetical protein